MSAVITAPNGLAEPRPDLADAFREWNPAGVTYAYDTICPVAQAPTQSGQMEVETVDSLLTDDNIDRTAGGAFNMIDIELGKLNYAIRGKGLAIPFHYNDGRVLTFDFEQGAARRLRQKVDLHYEGTVATGLFAAAVPTTAATAAWDVAAGVPLTDIETAINAFYGRVGMEPNALIINRRQRGALATNPEIIGRFPGKDKVGWQDVVNSIGDLLGISQVIVSTAISNTAAKGNVKALAPVFPDAHAAVALVAPQGAPLEQACVGRQLNWSDEGADDFIFEQYYWQPTHSEIYRVRGQKEINTMLREGATMQDFLAQRIATGL